MCADDREFHLALCVDDDAPEAAQQLVALLRQASRRWALRVALLDLGQALDLGDDLTRLGDGTPHASPHQLAGALRRCRHVVNLRADEACTRALISATIRAQCDSYLDAGRGWHVADEFDWLARAANTRLLRCDDGWAQELAILQASALLCHPLASARVQHDGASFVDLAARFPGVDVRYRGSGGGGGGWLAWWRHWCCGRRPSKCTVACLNQHQAWCKVQGPVARTDAEPRKNELAALLFAAATTLAFDAEHIEPRAGCMSVVHLGPALVSRLRLLGFQIVSGPCDQRECGQ